MINRKHSVSQLLAFAIAVMAVSACTIGVSAPIRTPVPTVVPTATPTSLTLQVFLIALEDNGRAGKKIGCDDSVVPVVVMVPHTQDEPQAALEALFSMGEFYGESGLYNALYQSDLHVESVSVKDREATVNLTGQLVLGGVCDNPRVEAQIEETVRQSTGAIEVNVFINGTSLTDLLSGEGSRETRAIA
jgi:hypothetical protein